MNENRRTVRIRYRATGLADAAFERNAAVVRILFENFGDCSRSAVPRRSAWPITACLPDAPHFSPSE